MPAEQREIAKESDHNGSGNGQRLVFQDLPTYDPPAEHYKFSQMPDYRRLRQDLDRVEDLGNPFFVVHEGTAKDTTRIDGRSLINYASYNYLGLSGDPRLNKAAHSGRSHNMAPQSPLAVSSRVNAPSINS